MANDAIRREVIRLMMGNVPTTDLLITDDVLIGPYQTNGCRAVFDTAAELQTNITMCGKDLADFFLG